jgi:ketosteroid isomerase-like protein
MSEENVEVVRRALEALDRRDLSSWLAVSDEDLEVVPSRDWPEPGVRGPEAAFDWYLKAFDNFQPFRTTDTEFIDAGADKVLLQYRMDLRGRESGAKLRSDAGTSSPSGRGRPFATSGSRTAPKPSKPPGFRSKGKPLLDSRPFFIETKRSSSSGLVLDSRSA